MSQRNHPETARPVVFVVELLEAFEIVIPVVQALRSLGVPMSIVVTPERDVMHHHSSDGEWYDVGRALIVWEWLSQNGFDPAPYVSPDRVADQVRRLDPRAVFPQSPYASQRHPSLEPGVLGAPIHYVDYGFHVDPEDASGWRFDDPFFAECAAVYVANDYEAERFIAEGVPSHVVVRSGPPALDRWDNFEGRSAHPTVMWCPWWSTEGKTPGSIGYSTFLVTMETVLSEFGARPDMRFIFRPHPLLLWQLVADDLWTEADLRAFDERLASMGNVENARTDIASTHIPQFEQAWAMVTDGVSFLAEFAYTGKMLLLTEVPGNPGWNPVGRAIRAVVETSHYVDGLRGFLDRVAVDHDPDGPRRREVVRAQFIRPQGGSGMAMARHLETIH